MCYILMYSPSAIDGNVTALITPQPPALEGPQLVDGLTGVMIGAYNIPKLRLYRTTFFSRGLTKFTLVGGHLKSRCLLRCLL